MSAQSEYRARLRKAGLCTRCGQRPPEEGKTTCSVCLDRLALRRRGKIRHRQYKQMNPSIATYEAIQRCPESEDIKACLECKRWRCVFDEIDKEDDDGD